LCWKNDEGWPVVAAGHRRLRAILRLNEREKDPNKRLNLLFNFIPAKTEAEAFCYTIIENRERLNPSPLDDGHNQQILKLKFGKSEEDIARIYYPEISTPEELAKAIREVKNCLALLELSPEAQEEYRKGFMSTSAALQLAEIPSRKQQNAVIEKTKKEGGKKLKVEDAKAAKEESQGKPAPKPTKQHDISENSPVKMLTKFRIFAELAGALAAEVVAEDFGRDYDRDTAREFANQVAVMCRKLNIPLEASLDKWASNNLDTPTVLDNF
jgi:ParB-like chromosome segregation protein Spo0J